MVLVKKSGKTERRGRERERGRARCGGSDPLLNSSIVLVIVLVLVLDP
jgi:hypothetical protein